VKTALLVVAHPSAGSFSHAMADAAKSALRGWRIALHDLYAERFDPVQPDGESRTSSDPLVEAHCRDLRDADLILVFHPNWWGQPPAILKGWIDRVFRPGVAYDYPPGAGAEAPLVGLLRAKAALVLNTSNTPAAREREVFGDPLEDLWKRCIFGACGVASVGRRMYGPMATSTSAEREAWLREVRELVERHA
jgi:putative NADPH-quinone reductase